MLEEGKHTHPSITSSHPSSTSVRRPLSSVTLLGSGASLAPMNSDETSSTPTPEQDSRYEICEKKHRFWHDTVGVIDINLKAYCEKLGHACPKHLTKKEDDEEDMRF